MAYTPLDPRVPAHRYNLDWTVGRGAFNYKDDVMLVQALLNICYFKLISPSRKDERKKAYGFEGIPPKGTTELDVDGICGKLTLQMIDAFQIDMKAYLHNDTKVDPFYSDTRKTPNGHRFTAKALLAVASISGDVFTDLPKWVLDPLESSLKRHDTDAHQHTQPWPTPQPKVVKQPDPFPWNP
jgi:hypothetical protein